MKTTLLSKSTLIKRMLLIAVPVFAAKMMNAANIVSNAGGGAWETPAT